MDENESFEQVGCKEKVLGTRGEDLETKGEVLETKEEVLGTKRGNSRLNRKIPLQKLNSQNLQATS